FKTDLYLPTSDIDIVIFNNIEKNNLSSFKQLLIDSKVCNEDTIIILDKAVVPIIKFRCAHSNIRVDITFKSSNATMASNYIKDAIKIFPAIKVLIVTLKQFLLQRDANEVYYGGISSYALILMTISFLKCIPHTSPNISIGKLLLGFLDFYGNKFDYMSQAISPTSPDGIVDKSSLAEIFWRKSLQPSLLCIQDPLDPTNDVGKSSFGVFKIKSYFSAAYSCLMEAIFMHMTMAKCHTESLHGNTLLGRIILITPEIIQYRKSLYEVYKNFSKFNQALYTDFHNQSDENQADFSNIADAAAGVANNNVIQEATELNALDSKQATNK
ncbi:MAG: Terminal nucleotidyltransferase 4A, partial [Marteilia pararefringens]